MINLTIFRTFYLTDNLLILYIFHIQYREIKVWKKLWNFLRKIVVSFDHHFYFLQPLPGENRRFYSVEIEYRESGLWALETLALLSPKVENFCLSSLSIFWKEDYTSSSYALQRIIK